MANNQRVRSLIEEKLPDKTTIEAANEYGLILVMHDGKVIHFGSPVEVFSSLVDQEVFSRISKQPPSHGFIS